MHLWRKSGSIVISDGPTSWLAKFILKSSASVDISSNWLQRLPRLPVVSLRSLFLFRLRGQEDEHSCIRDEERSLDTEKGSFSPDVDHDRDLQVSPSGVSFRSLLQVSPSLPPRPALLFSPVSVLLAVPLPRRWSLQASTWANDPGFLLCRQLHLQAGRWSSPATDTNKQQQRWRPVLRSYRVIGWILQLHENREEGGRQMDRMSGLRPVTTLSLCPIKAVIYDHVSSMCDSDSHHSDSSFSQWEPQRGGGELHVSVSCLSLCPVNSECVDNRLVDKMSLELNRYGFLGNDANIRKNKICDTKTSVEGFNRDKWLWLVRCYQTLRLDIIFSMNNF